ncbi:MAG: aldehyde dehydrogenase family protein [Flavobacteriales bacterium AspAUS03]
MIIKDSVGVVGQVIPWDFPLVMLTWKMAPAMVIVCTIIIKLAEQTLISAIVLIELIGELIQPGVVNIMNGFSRESGKPLVQSPSISKIVFTGEIITWRLII